MLSAGHVGGTRGSGIAYSAADVQWLSVVHGAGGFNTIYTAVCICCGSSNVLSL